MKRIYIILPVLLLSLVILHAKPKMTQLDKAKNAFNKQNYSDAKSVYDKILAKNSKNCEALLGRALTCIMLGDLYTVMNDMNLYITIDSLNPNAYNYLGYAQLYSDSVLLSKQNFSKVISLDSNYAEAYLNRAIANMSLQLDPLVIEDLDIVFKLDSQNIMAYKYYALTKHRMKNYAEAIKYYDLALEKGYDKPDIYEQRGNSYYKLKDYENAIADYTTAITLDSGNTDAINNRAATYHFMGKEDLALADKQLLEQRRQAYLHSIDDHYDIANSGFFSDDGNNYAIYMPKQFSSFIHQDSFAIVHYITAEKIDRVGLLFSLGAMVECIDSTQDKLGISSVADLSGYFNEYKTHALLELNSVNTVYDKQKKLPDEAIYLVNKSYFRFDGDSPDFTQNLVGFIKEGKIIIVRLIYPTELEFKYEKMVEDAIAKFRFN